MAKAKSPKKQPVPVDRREKKDRRAAGDRRKEQVPVAVERRTTERRKVRRRRQIDPTTCERDYTHDEIEFMQALDEYKRASGRMFPTCSEILEVVRKLGYVRIGSGDDQVQTDDSVTLSCPEIDGSLPPGTAT